jgi:hypothetical protein
LLFSLLGFGFFFLLKDFICLLNRPRRTFLLSQLNLFCSWRWISWRLSLFWFRLRISWFCLVYWFLWLFSRLSWFLRVLYFSRFSSLRLHRLNNSSKLSRLYNSLTPRISSRHLLRLSRIFKFLNHLCYSRTSTRFG